MSRREGECEAASNPEGTASSRGTDRPGWYYAYLKSSIGSVGIGRKGVILLE